MAPVPEPDNEVRFGLVLYGGVSLAIYIYGVAYEFQRLIRASEGVEVNAWTEVLKTANVSATVDIVSGASAGGINGLLLGKALATGADLRAVRSLWVDEADLGRLLRDAGEEGPKSMLQSARFAELLTEGLAEMDRQSLEKPLVSAFDLFIAATRIRPWVRDFATDLGGAIQTSNYRKSFELKFRKRGYNRIAVKAGYDRNDFEAARNKTLAQLAQATSAFPVAFEPVAIAIGHENAHLFADDEPPGHFSDGGILHNKPFTETISTILTRAAGTPVKRWLVSVEPDPEHAVPPAADAPAPEVTEVASKAVLGIPRYQSIAADLASIQEHRSRAAKGRQRLAGIDEALLAQLASRRDSADESVLVWRDHVLAASDYWSERWRRFRAGLIERLIGLAGEQAGPLAAELGEALDPYRGGAFLEADPDFEQRRVHHLLEMVRPLLRALEPESFARTAVAEAQLILWAQFDRIEDGLWSLSRDASWKPPPSSAGEVWVELYLARLTRVLAAASEGTRMACEALDRLWLEFGPGAEADRFTTAFDWFELWDAQLLTIAELSDAAARDEILLARISPGDARFIRKPAAQKLAGDALGHFGGFLKREWRANDVLWGRLDAAETISRILMHEVSAGGPEVDAQIQRAQGEIVRDELPDVTGSYVNHMENVHNVGAETLADVPMDTRANLVLQGGEVLRNMFGGIKEGDGPKVIKSAFGGLARILGLLLFLLRWPVRGIWGIDPAWRRVVSVCILFVGAWAIASLVLIAIGVVGTTSTLWVFIAIGLAVFLLWSGIQALFR
jgi:predicted acylesterase/phospholipase RssA